VPVTKKRTSRALRTIARARSFQDFEVPPSGRWGQPASARGLRKWSIGRSKSTWKRRALEGLASRPEPGEDASRSRLGAPRPPTAVGGPPQAASPLCRSHGGPPRSLGSRRVLEDQLEEFLRVHAEDRLRLDSRKKLFYSRGGPGGNSRPSNFSLTRRPTRSRNPLRRGRGALRGGAGAPQRQAPCGSRRRDEVAVLG